MRILISGASIAGPVLAWWLTHYGFTVTVVEKAPSLRKTGGHAVDLFRPSMRISEAMGVLPAILERATGTNTLKVHARGRTVVLDQARLFRAAAERHVEIMRDDLSQIFYDATRRDVEYIFGDSITEIGSDGHVEFDIAAPREFDLVVGADGLRSNVRRIVFGTVPDHYLGGCLAVASVPRELAVPGEFELYLDVGRAAGVYTADWLDDGRALFLFRRPEIDYDHHNLDQQREMLRDAFAGLSPQVDRWLGELSGAGSFYFDSLTQLRLDRWSSGRVTLVGDAACCPGPVVGGSTSLAVIAAYTLAGEIASANGDLAIALPAYEQVMAEPVRSSRAFAMRAAETVVPTSTRGVWALQRGGQLLAALPSGVARIVTGMSSLGLRLHDTLPVKDYTSVAVRR